jgi:hypothetical protein
MKKLAGSVLDTVLSDSSRPDYGRWCERHGIEGELFDRVVRRGLRSLPTLVRRRLTRMFYSDRVPTCRDFFFPWALERRAEAYRSVTAAAPAFDSVAQIAVRRPPAQRESQPQRHSDAMAMAAM